ncbi:MAG: hypothetical protein L3J91_00175, partial [Thermoplasmata archaeon]|nr:hypothetical protein [Thermoplasmata archaeon]
TSSTQSTLVVALPPFSVALSATPSSPVVGQTVTLIATVTGGTAPFAYQWSGDVAGCGALTGPTLVCSAGQAGPLQVSVTVVDVTHRSITGATTITFGAAGSSLGGRGTTASVGSGAVGLSPAFTSIYLTVAIFAACAVGVVTYRAGRRREAAQRSLRPLCYAVPAWSETPTEFPEFSERPALPAGDPGREPPSSG